MITGKTIALTRQIFVMKVMSLLFDILSRLVIALLLRSNHLSISWLLSPSSGILDPAKINSPTVSIVSPSICHEMLVLDAMIFIFQLHQETLQFLFAFCHKGRNICISEVIDISPSNPVQHFS